MTYENVIQEILPYVKKLIINEKDKIENNISDWLKAKGWFTRFVGTKFIPIVLDLITGPLLPYIITIIFNVICRTTAPYLSPFLPLIDQGIRYINDSILGEMERKKLLDILHIIVNNKQDLPELSFDEKVTLLQSQEYFA